MKIPETSANVGAYYGNEENGQWQSSQQYVVLSQPNGVLIDGGVGGGVVGSGDAGAHRPPLYPVHIPRQHMPGYVMAGGYFGGPYGAAPPPAAPDDFADYMWMENEEEFDKQVMQQLEEEALMEQCIEAMLEDEQRERLRPQPQPNGHGAPPTTSNGASVSLEDAVSRSTLNPLAAEFVPTTTKFRPAEEKQESPPEPSPQRETQDTERESTNTTELESTHLTEESKTEEPQPLDPPEVSAADLDPDDSRSRTPKVKPKEVRSEVKLPQRKREVKAVKSESGVGEMEDAVEVKQSQPAIEEPSGPKPINYAAAAKANKKKPATPPVEKPSPKPQEKPKPTKLADKPLQRKNSAK